MQSCNILRGTIFQQPALLDFAEYLLKTIAEIIKNNENIKIRENDLTINARYISRYKRVSGELIRFRNRSKLVERSLFAIIDLLQGAKSILL